jgi:hypothetical protein
MRARNEVIVGSGRRHADADFPNLAEVGQLTQPGEQIVGHEAQPRGAGGAAAGDDHDRTADLGDTAFIAQRFRQQSPELRGPAGLIGGTVQQTLQRSETPVAFGQQIIYLAAGHLDRSRCIGAAPIGGAMAISITD